MKLKHAEDENAYNNKAEFSLQHSVQYREENIEALDGKLPEPTSLEIVTPEVLAPVDSCEEMNPPMKDTKDLSGSSSLEKWLDTAGSALKSGNKGVAIIVALGMIAIPLMMTGSPWVSPILAAGAVLVAILSC